MSRIYKFTFFTVLLLATLACGLITKPIDQAQGLASTAEAIASSIPTGMPSGIPNIPGLPNVGDYLNPVGKPVTAWNEIPVMPQATAGQEFDKTTYSFKTSGVTETDIQTFYNEKLTALGWSSPMGVQGGGQGGVMLFTKDNQALTIVVTTDDKKNEVVIFLLE